MKRSLIDGVPALLISAAPGGPTNDAFDGDDEIRATDGHVS